MMTNKDELELYIHIPFCVKKCLYCDFLSAPSTEETREKYVAALGEELRALSTEVSDRKVVSVFFGGGTPSLLTGRQMQSLMDIIRECYHLNTGAEITMEINPGTVTRSSLEAYALAGINRLSIGLQSTHDAELKRLGRIHTYEDFQRVWEWSDGLFYSRSVDLMFGIPGQTKESFLISLQKILSFPNPPQHISAYGLIVEEGTPFYALEQEGSLELPDEAVEREMYYVTKNILENHGLKRYEISNYALPGFESLHNCGYWIRRDYLGFGLGSASLLNKKRRTNTGDLSKYLVNPCAAAEKIEILTETGEMEETMFLGLRMTRGVSFSAFQNQFNKSLENVYGDVIEKHLQDGLLWIRKEEGERFLCLTDRGLDLSNVVMADFLMDE